MESTQRATEVKCDGCQGNTATHWCVECKHYLCTSCMKIHRNLSETHTVLNIGEYGSTEPKSLTASQATENCSVHAEKKVDKYCGTCRVPVCTDCSLVEHRTPEHVHRDLKDAADEYLRDLKSMVDKLKAKEEEAGKNKTRAKQAHSDLTERCQKDERKVRTKAEEIISKVKREEQRVVDELNDQYRIKIKMAAADADQLEFKHSDIKSCRGDIEELMHRGNAAQLLSTKADAEHRIQQLIATDTRQQHADIQLVEFSQSRVFEERGILGEFMNVNIADVCIPNCTLENIPRQLVKGDSANLLVVTRDSTGKQVIPKQPVKATVQKPDASLLDIEVSDNRDGTHRVPVNGQLEGKYQVTVTIDNQPVRGSPAVIPVTKGMVFVIGTEGSEGGQYNNPSGLAINKNRELVVADRENKRLQITNTEGKVKIWQYKQFKKSFKPCDVAISSDNRHYSLDANNKQVVVSDENGKFIKCFGRGELKDPYGICVSPVNGNVYVTDNRKEFIKIYTQDGEYVRSFGSKGKGQGEFGGIWGIAVGDNGLVFVADHSHKCIHVFDSDDKFLYTFDCHSGDGELKCPRGIAIENDAYIYVTTGQLFPCIDHSLLKFRTRGKFVCRIDIEGDRLKCPTGIALTDNEPCRVVVADWGNHCIKVFVD